MVNSVRSQYLNNALDKIFENMLFICRCISYFLTSLIEFCLYELLSVNIHWMCTCKKIDILLRKIDENCTILCNSKQ